MTSRAESRDIRLDDFGRGLALLRMPASPNPLFVPPAFSGPLLDRPTLLEQLDSADAHVTLLLAPAGYGKTILAMQWRASLQRRHARIVWLGLGPADDDGELFVEGLVRGFTKAGLSPLHLAGYAPVVLRMLLDRIRQSGESWTLILDGLGPMTAGGLLQILLDETPANLRLMITARSRPNAALACLEIRGQVQELTARQLRFSTEEAAQLLGPASQPLAEAAEGWPAALQIARRWAAEHGETGHADFSGTTPPMARYIAEQVIAPLDPALQDFLRDASMLSPLDATAADAMREAQDSRALLGRLADLAPLLEAGNRLHPLLAQYLSSRLQDEAPERRRRLCRNASAHFAAVGDIVAATRYALLGGDDAAAARLVIELGGLRLYLIHGVGALRRIFAMLPAATVASVPRLRLIQALLMMKDGRVEDGRRLFRQIARESAPGDPVEQAEFAIDSKIIDCVYAGYHGRLLADRCLEELDAIVDQAPRFDPLLHGVLSITAAYSQQHHGHLDRAEELIGEARWYYRAARSGYADAFLQVHDALINLARGRLHAAERQLNAMMRLALREYRADTALPTIARLLIAEIRYERDDVSGAARLAEEALRSFDVIEGGIDAYAAGYVTAAKIAFIEHGPAGALERLDEADKLAQTRHGPSFGRIITATRITILLQADKLAAATALGLTLESVDSRPTHWRERDAVGLALARLAIAQHDDATASQHLARLKADALSSGRLLSAARAGLLAATIAWRAGDEQTALAALRDAIGPAQAEGLVRLFVDEGAAAAVVLIPLLDAFAAAQPATAAFARSIIRALGSSRGASWRHGLSPREYELLGQLAGQKSNKIIARQLGISERTVKFHLTNLFTKLGVHDRCRAVATARQLRLFA